jgi:hypothetical protein
VLEHALKRRGIGDGRQVQPIEAGVRSRQMVSGDSVDGEVPDFAVVAL